MQKGENSLLLVTMQEIKKKRDKRRDSSQPHSKPPKRVPINNNCQKSSKNIHKCTTQVWLHINKEKDRCTKKSQDPKRRKCFLTGRKKRSKGNCQKWLTNFRELQSKSKKIKPSYGTPTFKSNQKKKK